jgi:RNase P subunit RPR2
MYCTQCDSISYSSKTTIRTTKDGKEIIILTCAKCKEKQYHEKSNKTTVRIATSNKK